MPEALQGCHHLQRMKLDRRKALLLSLTVTVIVNMLAGVLTIIYVNGITIVETNPLSSTLLGEFGPGALPLHAILIAFVYSLAYLVSRIISSTHWLFKSKGILLFAFSLMIAVLPAGAFVDLLTDSQASGGRGSRPEAQSWCAHYHRPRLIGGHACRHESVLAYWLHEQRAFKDVV